MSVFVTFLTGLEKHVDQLTEYLKLQDPTRMVKSSNVDFQTERLKLILTIDRPSLVKTMNIQLFNPSLLLTVK